MKKILVILVLITLSSRYSSAQIYISGPISGVLEDTLYIVQGDIYVENTDSLTIEPGAQLIFENSVSFSVFGSLTAVGSESDSIVFINNTPSRWYGIFIQTSVADTLQLRFCQISGSKYSGIEMVEGALSLTRCSITDNDGSSGAEEGGGLRFENVWVSIDSCNIANNKADASFSYSKGAGIYADGCNLTITYTIFDDNYASSYMSGSHGGGIYITNSEAIIQNTEFTDNQAANTYLTFEAYGGGMYCTGSSILIENCVFGGNLASRMVESYSSGGGLQASGNSYVELRNTSFIDNDAGIWGSGAYVSNIHSEIIDCEFSHNLNEGLALGLGYYNVIGCVFTDNANNALTCRADSAIIQDCYFEGNTSSNNAGAISLYSCENTIVKDCELIDNTCLHNGGGIYCNSAEAEIFGCTIENSSAEDGGAIFINDSNISIDSCEIINNYASVQGGGIKSENSEVDIKGTLFYGNHTENTGGGVFISGTSDSPIILSNCTFTQNSTASVGSAVNLITENALISSSIFDHNEGVFAINIIDALIPIEYCDFWENEGGNFNSNVMPGTGLLTQTNINGDSCDVYSNIFLDPLFEDPLNGNFSLTENSSCIDAGDPNFPLDPDSTIADIGAYYFDQNVGVADDTFAFCPQTFALDTPFPNPFNSTVRIAYAVPQAGRVELTLFDITGRTVATIFDGWKSPGNHDISYNPGQLASGIYFLRMSAENFTKTQKVVYLK